ncbi:MAG TPA: carbon monoxide dehydrogenase [Gammaproteobacteria bacterium]|nr:carbon monoxide dehydrogenase [Gammaproteobacteria bacterium]|tara:strand:+ start:113 stop:550 length:438 start_codon:yes stop_codon:yes gene_type:complete
MEIQGEYWIDAAPQHVWQDLNDPEVLRACIPGCESISQVGDDEYECDVIAKFGPVKAKFKSKLSVCDSNPPHSYAIVGEGKGGVVGFGKGRADVQLVAEGTGTQLRYNANVTVGGKLAQIGSRLLSATTRKLSDQFFSAFSDRFE